MELYHLRKILDMPTIKIIDSSVIMHTELGGTSILHHLYDCDRIKDIEISKLEEALSNLHVSDNFFQATNIFFTSGVMAESSYFLKRIEESIRFFKSRQRIDKEEDNYRMGLLKEIQESIYLTISHMKPRNVYSQLDRDNGQFLQLRNYLSELSKKNGLKMKKYHQGYAPKSKKTKDMLADEEIVAAGLILSRKEKGQIHVLTGDWDIDRIARHIVHNFESLDSSLIRNIKNDIVIYHPDKVARFFYKTEKIPAYFN